MADPLLCALVRIISTDHAALQWLASARFNDSKLERWALAVQQYDLTVECTIIVLRLNF